MVCVCLDTYNATIKTLEGRLLEQYIYLSLYSKGSKKGLFRVAHVWIHTNATIKTLEGRLLEQYIYLSLYSKVRKGLFRVCVCLDTYQRNDKDA